nr:cysteine-rich secretory protein [Hediste diversicolor]
MTNLIILFACFAFAVATPIELINPDANNYEEMMSKRGTCGAQLARLSSRSATNFLNAHNTKRQQEGQGLSGLTWDSDLAARAQELANKCVFNHGLATDCNGKSCGQNIYYSGGSSFSAAKVVDSWYSEKNDFTYSSNSCASGKACGHYTQIVWKSTQKVGCAVADCTGKVMGYSPEYIAVCNYFPPGNYIGQKPY